MSSYLYLLNELLFIKKNHFAVVIPDFLPETLHTASQSLSNVAN